jgi:uncharacterized protein YsxB (DUF464 family)
MDALYGSDVDCAAVSVVRRMTVVVYDTREDLRLICGWHEPCCGRVCC